MRNLGIEVALARLDSLRPHEESIEDRALYVKNSIIRTRVLRKPLLVDKRTNVILDGAHRHRALRELGITIAPVIYVDYLLEEEIRVSRWVRIYVLRDSDKILLRRILDHVQSYSCDVIDRSSRNLVSIELVARRALEAYRVIQEIERDKEIISSIKEIIFRTNLRRRPLGEKIIAIIPPTLRKEEVIEAALSEDLLPPKSTRHITILKKIQIPISIKTLAKLEKNPSTTLRTEIIKTVPEISIHRR